MQYTVLFWHNYVA